MKWVDSIDVIQKHTLFSTKCENEVGTGDI